MIDTRLKKIKNLSDTDLRQDSVITMVRQLADEYLNDVMIGEAAELWRFLAKHIGQFRTAQDGRIVAAYQGAIDKLAWTAATVLPLAEVERLVKSKLNLAFESEINVIDKIEGFMNFGDPTDQEKKRRTILLALKENNEKFGINSLKIQTEDVTYPPFIKNWLKDYDQSSAVRKRVGRLSLVEYLNNSRNAKQLSPEQQAFLRDLLALYDYLRFLIQGGQTIVARNQLPDTPVAPPVEAESIEVLSGQTEHTESNLQHAIVDAYTGDKKFQTAVEKEEAALSRKFAGAAEKLADVFYKAVQSKNVAQAMAALRAMAQADALESFLQTDQKLNQFLVATWQKQYGQALVAEFQLTPAQPKFVRLFLQYVLQQRLGMSENDAARAGMQLGNILVNRGKKGYTKLAYFDVSSKSFKWFE